MIIDGIMEEAEREEILIEFLSDEPKMAEDILHGSKEITGLFCIMMQRIMALEKASKSP